LLSDLTNFFGVPTGSDESVLGYYPAIKYSFPIGGRQDRLFVFVREGRIILIETKNLPDLAILRQLPQPGAVLPHEILVEGAYASELIFPEIGLNLTVARHFDKTKADTIVRCRGVKRMVDAAEFDTRYYKSFENSISW